MKRTASLSLSFSNVIFQTSSGGVEGAHPETTTARKIEMFHERLDDTRSPIE
jgi:hypothetical protein